MPRLVREDRPALDRGLAAKGFGFGGVQRERAYHDALRDLATPAMGHPPVVRIAAVDGDGAAAYRRHRDRAAGARSGADRRPGASCSSVTATLTVEQRPQRTRTFFVICIACIASARTLPHCTQT